MTLGPAIGGFLAAVNYSWLFPIDAATCLVAAVLLWATLSPKASSPERPAKAEEETGSASPWRDLPFLIYLLLTFLLASVVFQLLSTFPLTLSEQYGLSESRIGLVLAFNTVLIVLFEMVVVHRLERRSPLKVLAVGAFLACAGFGLLPFGSSFAFALVSVAVWTSGEMLTAPMSEGFVASRAAAGSIGRFMGLFVLAWSTALVTAPLAGTYVYERFGSDILWWGCGGLGFVLLGGYSALGRFATPMPVEEAVPEEG